MAKRFKSKYLNKKNQAPSFSDAASRQPTFGIWALRLNNLIIFPAILSLLCLYWFVLSRPGGSGLQVFCLFVVISFQAICLICMLVLFHLPRLKATTIFDLRQIINSSYDIGGWQILYALLALLFIGSGIYASYAASDMYKAEMMTQIGSTKAIVTDVRNSRRGNSMNYRYRVDGKNYEVIGTNEPGHKTGDSISICYSQIDPAFSDPDCIIDTGTGK